MKRKLHHQKILMLVLIVAIVMSTVFPVVAETTSPLMSNTRVAELLSDLNEKADYAAARILKGVDDQDRYVYLPFSSGGYLVYDMKMDIISEYSTTSCNHFIETTDSVYYMGALQYYTEENGVFREIATGKEAGTRETLSVRVNEIDQRITRNQTRSRSLLADTRAAHYIGGTLPNYSHNPDGICGSTAAAMLLRWYDNNVDDNYVPTYLESSSGVDLIEHLRDYIDGSVPGSYPGDVYNGILSYCSDRGVGHDGGIDMYDENYVIGRVDSYGIPFLVNLQNDPSYGFHWVAGYGYNISGGVCYPIVNDGHGRTGVALNPGYAEHIVW